MGAGVANAEAMNMAVDFKSQIGKPRTGPTDRPVFQKLTAGDYELEFQNIEESTNSFGSFVYLHFKVLKSTGKGALPKDTLAKWQIKTSVDENLSDLVAQKITNVLVALNGGPDGVDEELYGRLIENPGSAAGTKIKASVTKQKSKKGMSYDAADFAPAN
jgi:hypothetical protein